MVVQVRAKGRVRPRHEPGKMNRTEAKYAAHLDILTAAGEICGHTFEAVKFFLGPKRTTYTPDFMVIDSSGFVSYVDVKGGPTEDDARVKIKMAAYQFPWFGWAEARETKKGGWELTWFND